MTNTSTKTRAHARAHTHLHYEEDEEQLVEPENEGVDVLREEVKVETHEADDARQLQNP